MKSDEVERLVREFIKTNPQYTKNSFYIDLEGTVQVMPGIVRLEDLKEIRNVPSDAQRLADIDEQGNIPFSSMITSLKRCTSLCSITVLVK